MGIARLMNSIRWACLCSILLPTWLGVVESHYIPTCFGLEIFVQKYPHHFGAPVDLFSSGKRGISGMRAYDPL
jgi:hypothetical protein